MADLLTNAQLAQLINDALSKWNAREAEQYAWVSGSATGGPNGDGRYPLSNGSGGSSLIDSPAKLADLLNGPAALAGAARDAALTFRDAAESAATAASTDKALANNHKLAAQDARDLAAQYRNEIAALLPGFNANASMVQAASLAVAADVDLMEALLEEGYVARDAAVTAQTAAEAAAALAATFNPNDYYTKVAADGRYLQLTNFTWSNLSGKPSTFAPSAHTHLISEITGLQAALDSKQAAGSYAAAVHTHVIGDVTGLQAALDGKQAAGSYAAAVHSHVIGDVTGLQDALNAKADGNHSHSVIYSSTADFYGGLQNWNAIDRADINPDTSYWYGIRVGHGSAETYYSATLALSFFSDDFKFRRKAAGVDQTWRTIWHDGNFTPASKSDVGHTHIIGNITGLQDALNDKVTRSNTGVRFGVLPYKAALWVNDGSDGTGIGGWARSFAIQAGSNSTHGGFFTAYGGDTQAAEVRIGVGTVDTSYTQTNALCISSTGMTWANNAVWHGGNFDPNSKLTVTAGAATLSQLNLGDASKFIRGGGAGQTILGVGDVNSAFLQVGGSYYSIWNAGNFDPNSKLNTSGGSMNGALTMSSSPIVMAFSGSLPYLDMQVTGVSGGRNYRIRSGIEGVSNAGFSIKDLTSDTNVLSIDGSGALYTGNAKFVHKSNFGYSPSYKTVVLGGEYLTTVSLGYDPSANASGSFNGNGEGREVLFRNGVSFLTPNAANNSYHLTLNMADGKVGVGTTSPITSLDTVGDITARGGNIFVRENPSGAGAGMRLHHSGGGAYIDFDGNLNFRNGEGGGLVTVDSSGNVIGSNLIGADTVRAGGWSAATGFTMLNNGTLSNPGYLAWYAPGGTRVGYMGWAEGSNIVYQAEAGWGLKFNSNVTFATSNPLYASAGIQTLGQIRACGWYAAPSGGSYTALGVEIGVSGGNGYIYAYDRNASAYGPLRLGGSNIYAENPFTFNSTATFGSYVDVLGGNLRINSGGDDSAMGAYVGFRNSVNGERGWIGYGEGNSRMRVNNSIGSVWVSGTDVQLVVNNAGSSARVATAYGYLDLGPLNSSWCHYNTDRPAHYFNTAVHVNGAIMRYNEGAALHHGSSSMGSGRITVSTSSPSGGADGDVWFKVA